MALPDYLDKANIALISKPRGRPNKKKEKATQADALVNKEVKTFQQNTCKQNPAEHTKKVTHDNQGDSSQRYKQDLMLTNQ